MNFIRIVKGILCGFLSIGFLNAGSEPFVPVLLKGVENNLSSECTVQDTRTLAKQVTRFTQPLPIPFISIRNYLTEYSANRPYIPEKALLIKTSLGRFRLWANEQGIVYAPDLKQKVFSLDEWEAKTLFNNITMEQDLQKRYLLVLILKVFNNKLKLVLQQA